MNTPIRNHEDLMRRVEAAKKSGIDLSMEEDLAIAIMNLVSLEEHFFFSGAKSGKPGYYDLLDEVREMRKSLLARMLPRTEAESWCISKHLLATTMRLIEVGTKLRSSGDKKGAEEVFGQAYKAFNMFFALRLKIVEAPKVANPEKGETPMTLDDVMRGLINCCKE